MKKIIKIVSIAAAIFATALVCHSYFYVKGTEIDGIARVADTTGIVIKKSYLGITDEREFVLNEVQKEMLKALVQGSDFTRILSTWVQFDDKDQYAILIVDHEQEIYLSIHSTGGEYISIPDQFNGKHLKINNAQWKSTLEEIIALSDANSS